MLACVRNLIRKERWKTRIKQEEQTHEALLFFIFCRTPGSPGWSWSSSQRACVGVRLDTRDRSGIESRWIDVRSCWSRSSPIPCCTPRGRRRQPVRARAFVFVCLCVCVCVCLFVCACVFVWKKKIASIKQLLTATETRRNPIKQLPKVQPLKPFKTVGNGGVSQICYTVYTQTYKLTIYRQENPLKRTPI